MMSNRTDFRIVGPPGKRKSRRPEEKNVMRRFFLRMNREPRRSGWIPVALSILAMSGVSSAPAFGQCGELAAPSTSAVAAGGDFNTAGTWSAGAPNSTTNACIINGTGGSYLTVTLAAGAVGNALSLQVNANNTLNLLNNSILLVNGPQIINDGSIGVNAAANNVILGLNASTTLATQNGTGTVTLSQTGTGSAIIQQQVSGLILTNDGSTIQGAGTIGNGGGLAVINHVASSMPTHMVGRWR